MDSPRQHRPQQATGARSEEGRCHPTLRDSLERRRLRRHATCPANHRVIRVLLAAWLVLTFGVAYFARELQFQVFGWPFSFWMGAQGGVLAYVVITWLYARRIARLEREAH